MAGLSYYILVSLRLHARNRMALAYNYLFPTFFLVAFATLYRHERVPLAAHIGELLTVTVLGGACFGLPTTLVSERERGVWRRYRLLPVPMSVPVLGTLTSRMVLLALAVVLQLGLAMAIGFPGPEHWLDLALALSAVCIAFMGLGLVIAALANSVPAVQALGQCVFLPMLIVGGVAVPLASLPDWAQRVSTFLPGRYAVEIIQASVTGSGIESTVFSLSALLTIGAAAAAAGLRLFRWDPEQRIGAKSRYWAAAAFVPWVIVGVAAQWTDAAERTPRSTLAAADSRLTVPAPTPLEQSLTQSETVPRPEPAAGSSPRGVPRTPSVIERADETTPTVTLAEIDAKIAFDRLPPDGGVVTPIASALDTTDPVLADALAPIYTGLTQWPPARVADQEQRVRNLLYVPAVVDLLQLPIEPYVPLIVFDRIQGEIDERDLVPILYRIAVDWSGGTDDAVDDLGAFGLSVRQTDVEQIRNRAAVYAVKLLGRLIGRLGP